MSRESENERDEAEREEFTLPALDDTLDDNEITVILPAEEEVDGEAFAPTDNLEVSDSSDTTDSFDVTDTVLLGPEETEEVFVLLPDAEESEIPMVDTEEVSDDFSACSDDDTELATASQVGLRHENPVDVGGSEEMSYEVEEDDFGIDDDATDPVHPEDLDDLASDVEDDLFHDGGARGQYDEEDFGLDDSFDEIYRPQRSRGGFGFKKIFVGMAALALLSAAGLYFFSEQVRPYVEQVGLGGILPGGDRVVVDGSVDPLPVDRIGDIGETPISNVDPISQPNALAQQSRELFQKKFVQAIELGFAGEASR